MKVFAQIFKILFLAGIVSATIWQPVQGQTPEAVTYQITINRDSGYGLGENIRGLFTLNIIESKGIESVSYYLDDQLIGKIDQSPFFIQFDTAQYSFGEHILTAEITNQAGQVYSTPVYHLNFVTPEEETSGTKDAVLPIVLATTFFIIIIGLVQFFIRRKK